MSADHNDEDIQLGVNNSNIYNTKCLLNKTNVTCLIAHTNECRGRSSSGASVFLPIHVNISIFVRVGLLPPPVKFEGAI